MTTDQEPRIGVFADDEYISAQARAIPFEELPSSSIEIVSAALRSDLIQQLTALKSGLPRIDLVITDQYGNSPGMRAPMNGFLNQVRTASPSAWVIETGAMAGKAGFRKFYDQSDVTVDYNTLHECLRDLDEESVPKSFMIRVRKLINMTNESFIQASRIDGKRDPDDQFDPLGSLQDILTKPGINKLLELLDMSPVEVFASIRRGDAQMQVDVMHSMWTILGNIESRFEPENYLLSVKRLASLIRTGFPSEYPE